MSEPCKASVGCGVGQRESGVPDLAGSRGRPAGRGEDTDFATITFHFKVSRIQYTIFCFEKCLS